MLSCSHTHNEINKSIAIYYICTMFENPEKGARPLCCRRPWMGVVHCEQGFRCGRFGAKIFLNFFEIYGVFAQTRWERSIFQAFVRTSFTDGPKYLLYYMP